MKLTRYVAAALFALAVVVQAQVGSLGPTGSTGSTELKKVTVTLDAATVNLLDTSPITVVSAKPGISYVSTWMAIVKQAGTAYTVSASQCGSGNAAPYNGIDAVGFLDQAGLTARYRSSPTFTGAGDNQLSYVGQDLTVRCFGTISGGTGSVSFTIWYLELPAS